MKASWIAAVLIAAAGASPFRAAIFATPAVEQPLPAVTSSNALDTLIFGDASSESSHGLVATDSAVFQNEWRLAGSGAIGGAGNNSGLKGTTADAGFFRYQSLAGDGFIQARMTGNGGDRQNRVGVMVRETLQPGARMVYVMDNWWDQLGPAILWRDQPDTLSHGEKFKVERKPLWARIERKGTKFTLSASADGQSWKTIAEREIAMGGTVYAGLAVASNNEKLVIGKFDRLTSSMPAAPWTASDFGAVGVPGYAEVFGFGEPSRRLLPREPVNYYGGDLTFRMKVDPQEQNYCTIKIWGSEGELHQGRVALVCEGQEIGRRHGAFPMFIDSYGPVCPGNFWYRTTILPKWLTEGKTSVEIKLRSTGHFYAYGKVWNYDTYQYKLEEPTRGLYRLHTHTNPVLEPGGARQGKMPDYHAAPARPKEDLTAGVAEVKRGINEAVRKMLQSDKLSGMELQLLARAYAEVTWTEAHQNSEALQRIVQAIDSSCRRFHADPKSAGGEWGGGFASEGLAVALIASRAASQFDEKVDLGAGPQPRRQQWAEMLQASRDFGRVNRKTITNQAIACDGNIYRANKGLLALGAQEAFPEEQARRYLREAAGLEPYRHSDTKDGGSTWQVGHDIFMVTPKGTTHEWHWCSHDDYGRMSPYVFDFYRLSGDPQLRERAMQMEYAHAAMLYPFVDSEGFRGMLNEGVITCRNLKFPGHPGYAYLDVAAGSNGDARLLGAVRQQLDDGQLFHSWNEPQAAIFLPDDLDRVLKALPQGSGRLPRLPTSPDQPDFAWADEQNAVLSIHRGAEQHFITFASGESINYCGNAHSLSPQGERVVVFAIDDVRFTPSGQVVKIGPEVQTPFSGTPPDKPVSAFAGREQPKPLKENGEPGIIADFYGTRYGDYLIGMNCTFKKTFAFKPEGFTSGVDLISGQRLTAPLQILPQSTVVLYAPR